MGGHGRRPGWAPSAVLLLLVPLLPLSAVQPPRLPTFILRFFMFCRQAKQGGQAEAGAGGKASAEDGSRQQACGTGQRKQQHKRTATPAASVRRRHLPRARTCAGGSRKQQLASGKHNSCGPAPRRSPARGVIRRLQRPGPPPLATAARRDSHVLPARGAEATGRSGSCRGCGREAGKRAAPGARWRLTCVRSPQRGWCG